MRSFLGDLLVFQSCWASDEYNDHHAYMDSNSVADKLLQPAFGKKLGHILADGGPTEQTVLIVTDSKSYKLCCKTAWVEHE